MQYERIESQFGAQFNPRDLFAVQDIDEQVALGVTQAAEIITKGGLVAIPTETVYGLAADATNDQATAKIFEAKGRPQFNPLIIHVADKEMAKCFVEFSPIAEILADTFWPGALTIVLPRLNDSGLSHLVSAGLDTVAVRMPAHKLAHRLIVTADRPLAAPSANRSGTISPTSAEHVRQSLGDRVDYILDGGPCTIGVESTIVKVVGEIVVMLRPGGIAREEIERAINTDVKNPDQTTIIAPGMMHSHYAPNAAMLLNVASPDDDCAFLDFGATVPDHPYGLDLSPTRDDREGAANLFSHMRELDRLCEENSLRAISVAPIPAQGLGEAINDRLRRAAAPQN